MPPGLPADVLPATGGMKRKEGEAPAPVVAETPAKGGKGEAPAKRPRAAAAAGGAGRYAEDSRRARSDGDDRVAVKVELAAVSEEQALEATAGAPGKRRVFDFTVTDAEGLLQPVLSASGAPQPFPLFLTAYVLPEQGPLPSGKGALKARFTAVPIASVSLGQEGASAECVFHTHAAAYAATKPAAPYRHIHDACAAAAAHAREVVKALDGPEAQPQLEFKDLAARVARMHGVSLSIAKGFLVRDAPHILARLMALDGKVDPKGKGKSTKPLMGSLPFTIALRAEVSAAAAASLVPLGNPSRGIVIRDGAAAGGAGGASAALGPTSTSDAQMSADAALARAMGEAEQSKGVKKAQKSVQRAAAAAAGREAYIKIDESEFKEEYPAPLEYTKEEEEMDELLMGDMDDDDVVINPVDLPRRILTDFSIYKDDGMMATLELMPMWAGVDPDLELYASGVVAEDDGENYGLGGVAAAGAAAAGGAGSSSAAASVPAGLRVYLSAVKEWILEFGCDMLFISLRTDSAWYRLVTPAAAYAPWWAPLLRASRVAVRALTLVSAEERAARLTLDALVKKLADEAPDSLTFISAKAPEVERYLAAHGQILLNQFRSFPNASVQKSSIPVALRERMTLRRHTALAVPKGGGKRAGGIRRTGLNLNPVRSQAARAKPMRATTTALVHRVWAATVAAAEEEVLAAAEEEEAEAAAKAANDTGAGEDEAEEAPEEAPAKPAARKPATRKVTPKKVAAPSAKASWGDEGTKAHDGTTAHALLRIGAAELRHGDAVWLPEEQEEEEEEEEAVEPARRLALIMKLWEEADGDKWVMARAFVSGSETVLRGAASERELFLSSTVITAPIAALAPGAPLRRLERPWGFVHRAAAEAEDAADRADAAARAAQGRPLTYLWRRMYLPEQGAFLDPPKDVLDAEAHIAAVAAADKAATLRTEGKGFHKDGVVYAVGDYLYLKPEAFKEIRALEMGKKHDAPEYLKEGRTQKGASQELRAFGVAKLLSVEASGRTPEVLTVRRMVRPEELGPTYGYQASRWAILDADIEVDVDVSAVVGPCTVLPPGSAEGPNTFVCCGTWDAEKRAVAPPPAHMPVPPAAALAAAAAAGKPAMRPEAAADHGHATQRGDPTRLRTLDIFAGCGGLSEGMRQAGAARSMWAIEYEPDAAEAFRQNHPGAHVFNANCNVILRRCMSKVGLPDAEALACPEAEEQAKAMAAEEIAALPLPGEVEFICGGPPCQGFSGMNRFTAKGSLWSKVQNEMILSFLSYADIYRPRFFLLENVRNFVAFNKGLTFRTALRTLVEMGYQVRFGVLNAAFYGVGQSRKRAFLLAAAPGETMPDWPRPQTCFNSPQLTFDLPCGTKFCAVPQGKSAPLRAVTVRDMIGDLPALRNGADVDDMAYDKQAESAFQKDIRGSATRLQNHICKVLNEVNEKRCSLIPKESNHDWRYLKQLVEEGEVEEIYQTATMSKPQPLVPWCLPNTAHRHNGWRGLYSRLDWAGHFPTSTTDPNPMGKVGQVFHPNQDRIVSVRECARSQGFPDSFTFWGPVSSKHRQVGNAVPPPLAAALGRELRKALEATEKRAGKQ